MAIIDGGSTDIAYETDNPGSVTRQAARRLLGRRTQGGSRAWVGGACYAVLDAPVDVDRASAPSFSGHVVF